MGMYLAGIIIVVSLVLLVLTAAGRELDIRLAYAHMGVAAIVAAVFFMSFARTNMALRAESAGESRIAANTSRYLGLVWAWGALVLASTYGTGVLPWREWPTFLVACVLLSGLCLFFAATLEKDARAGRDDAAMLKLGRILAIVLLVSMLATMAGLLIDGKMSRFLTPRFTDWAANNVFFFGAMSMAMITGYALYSKSSDKPVRDPGQTAA
jgi:hypothetical protein